MAESTLNINVRLGDAERKVSALSKQLNKLEKSGDRASRSSTKLGGSMARLAGQVSLLAGGYLALRTAINAVSTFRVFEQSIANLSAITGATGDDLQFLSDSARELGKTTTLSATQVADAFKLIASAKPDLLENIPALRQMTIETIALAEAAGIDMPTAASALGNALNQFGKSADSAGRFINVLAAGAKFGASSIAESAGALRDAGVSASGANVSFEELNASIQTLSLVGLRGQRAGVALRNIILKLQTEGVAKLDPAVVGLTQALRNLGEENRSVTELAKLFGLESINAAQALISGVDATDKLTKNLTGTNIAYEQAAKNTDTLDGSIKRLNSAYEELQILFASDVNPQLRNFIDLLGEALLALPQLLNDIELFTATGVSFFQEMYFSLKLATLQLLNFISGAFQTLGAAIVSPIKLALESLPDFLGVSDLATSIQTVGEASNKTAAEIKRLNEQYDREVKLSREIHAEAIKENAIRKQMAGSTIAAANAIKNLTDDMDNNTIAVRKNIEVTKELLRLYTDEFDALDDEIEPIERFYDALIAAEGSMGLTGEKIKLLNKLYEEGVLSMKTYTDAMNELTVKQVENIDEQETGFDRLKDAIDGYGQKAASTFTDFITSSGEVKDSFSDMAESILKDIADMVIQMLIMEPLMKSIKDIFSGGFGGSPSPGSASFIGPVQPRAGGGDVEKNSPYLIGEKGAELFIPNQSGVVIPNNRLPTNSAAGRSMGASAGNTTVIVNNNSDNNASVKETTDGQGNINIEVLIDKSVQKSITGGRMDSTFNSVFGLKRRGFV